MQGFANELVTIEKVNGSELLMEGYLTIGKAIKKRYEGREYEIERYQGEHANEYCVYETKDGVRNGTAELFNEGMVKMRWIMKNGVRDGKYVVFDNGVAIREGQWADVGKEEERVIENRRYGLVMVIRVNGEIVYEGGYCSEMKRNGRGYEYEKGVQKLCGKWRDDKLVAVSHRFINNDEMIEYGEEPSLDPLYHRPQYVGGFVFDDMSGVMKRNGFGRVLNEMTGICEYESEWKEGVEKKGKRVPLIDGWYHEHTHGESTRQAVNGADPIKIGSRVLVTEPMELELFRIASNCYNDYNATHLILSGLLRLKQIVIGDNSFGCVRLFELIGLKELESIVVGSCSFTYAKSDIDVFYSTQADGLYRIADCPKLKTIQIGRHSFSDYCSLELKNLPSLQQVVIGWQCFYRAPVLELRGKKSVPP